MEIVPNVEMAQSGVSIQLRGFRIVYDEIDCNDIFHFG